MDERVPWQTAPINKAVTVDAYSPLGHSQVSDVYILHKMSERALAFFWFLVCPSPCHWAFGMEVSMRSGMLEVVVGWVRES